MRLSVIDIGTNTMLLLIGDFDAASSQILSVQDVQRIPRLGKGVDSNRNISGTSVQKAVNVLNEYKKLSGENFSAKIVAVATSFLRDAKNKYEFLKRIKEETGIDIEILSGEDEARWSFWGCIYGFLDRTAGKSAVVIDIGGGSTEVTSSSSLPSNITGKSLIGQNIGSMSMDMGSVRIKERYLRTHPPSGEDLANAERFIIDGLGEIKNVSNNQLLIGGAGTITALAALNRKLKDYDAGQVERHVLSVNDIHDMLDQFQRVSLEQLRVLGDYMEGRADVILPGTLILKCFMEKFGFEELHVSAKGLRYGIFLRESITN